MEENYRIIIDATHRDGRMYLNIQQQDDESFTLLSMENIRPLLAGALSMAIRASKDEGKAMKETMDYLQATHLYIISEIIIPVNFCIATKENNLSQVNRIYSKDIAFNQCKGFLSDYFGQKESDFFVDIDSTSKAAKQASL